MGAGGDVQNFGGCQAPAAPVLTQALIYHHRWVLPHRFLNTLCNKSTFFTRVTLFESENEWQKIEQVPLPLPRASGNFSNVKTRMNLGDIFIYPFWEADGQDLENRWDYLRRQIIFFFSCFDIREVPKSPGK